MYDKLVCLVKTIFYEIYYGLLGFQSLIEDAIAKKKNVCPLVDREGSVAVVTGGARGIGSEIVKKLLLCKMTVVIGCRNTEAGEKTIKRMRDEQITSGHAVVYPLDLKSFESIKTFAKLVCQNHKEVHLLINNAGIMISSYERTVDGFEAQWAVNFLGPALLTHYLLPVMKNAAKQQDLPTRIVNVSSCAHFAAGPFDFENINKEENHIASLAYGNSKLAQILFSNALQNQLKSEGTPISVYSVHPGIVNTDLFEGTSLKRTMPWILTYFSKTVEEGATSVVFAAISSSLNGKGGIYLANCQQSKTSALAKSTDLQSELFSYMIKTLGIVEFGTNPPLAT